MRLTRLELKGFKSFADKTVVHFDNDITGIVGPNGCGKSNVVDAIRWVLGEQRAKTLRLEKMDNIIFNGTKDRKPANMAEVSLTFDNTRNLIPTEFNQVTITRTIYRTGESEYQINGVTCRLKDIRNLFLDTGIGSSTYAIMELKMIDDVLNDVDNSRRMLIEQAAGISKYKSRKHETLLKLKATEADLTRVEDLLHEINNNLKSLESQARKANRFKKLKEEFRDLTVQLARYDMLFINDKYEALDKEAGRLGDARTALETAMHQGEAGLQQLRQEVLERERSLSSRQKDLNQFVHGIQQKESDRKVARQQVEFLTNRVGELEGQQERLAAEEGTLDREIAELREKISAEESAIGALKAEVAAARGALEAKREASLALRESLDAQRQAWQEARNRLNESEKSLAVKESSAEGMRNSIQRSLFEKEERQESVRRLSESIDKLQEKAGAQRELIGGLEVSESENETKIAALEASVEKRRNALMELRRDLDARSNELRLTRNMVDNLEGFPESIKYLKKQDASLREAQLLSDLLYCDEAYRVALELALKPWLNHFIVETEAGARQSIGLLKQAGKGRAHFFVLDDFRRLPETERPAGTPEGCVPALDVVETDEAFRPIFSFLLRDTYIVNGDLPPDAGDGAVFIDKAGGWIRSRVELSGGAVGLFEGKRLGRAKNLEKLEKEVEKLRVATAETESLLRDDQAALNQFRNNSFRKTIEREQRELQQLERELATQQSRLEQFREFAEQQSRRHEEVEAGIRSLEAEIESLRGECGKLSGEAELQQHRNQSLEGEFKTASLEFNRMQEAFQEVNIRFIQNENAIQSYRQTLKFREGRLATVRDDLARGREEHGRSVQGIADTRKQLAALEEELVGLYREADERKHDLTGRENEYYELKEAVQAKEESLRKQQRERETIEAELVQNREKRNNLKFELQSLRQRLSLEFKVDVEAMLEELDTPEVNRTELEMKLDSASRRIEQFGEVNPMAEAAYEEMKKRYDFITEQRQDLIEARDSLMETISEIEYTAREHFMDSFLAIRENFKNVFRSMFSEHDDCDLILADPDDPLESKVEIVAKPKGKRPQGINQLSGGEKSLTSLSLLFALYLFKPAPFCILDEVDAPLDDANIQKFNQAIRTFAGDSQFIIVTHNKQTMASVDVTYGVTMHKAGISMLVPADFRSFREAGAMAS